MVIFHPLAVARGNGPWMEMCFVDVREGRMGSEYDGGRDGHEDRPQCHDTDANFTFIDACRGRLDSRNIPPACH